MWIVRIIDPNSEIWDHELDIMVKELPSTFRKFIPYGETMRQVDGYPAYGTISIPKKNSFTVSGNYIVTTSEKSAEFLFYILMELKKNHHKKLIVESKVDLPFFPVLSYLVDVYERERPETKIIYENKTQNPDPIIKKIDVEFGESNDILSLCDMDTMNEMEKSNEKGSVKEDV